jgi:hypothetical protein
VKRLSRDALVLLLAGWSAAAILGGCASLGAANARDSYLKAELAPYRYATSCDRLWPDVLRLLQSKGFPLGGRDMEAIGEAAPGFLAEAIADGHSTYRTKDGGLEMATDWNRQLGTRYRANGNPSGPDGCRVVFTRIAGGVASPNEQELGPDWEMALELLRRVDPGAAARVESGAP